MFLMCLTRIVFAYAIDLNLINVYFYTNKAPQNGCSTLIFEKQLGLCIIKVKVNLCSAGHADFHFTETYK